MAKKITQNVNKDKFFNDLPKVRPERSSWKTPVTNYMACNLGDIVPIYVDEVLPNEEREIDSGMISHTTTPIAPIFPAMYTEIRCFYIPFRLCADLLNGYSERKSPFVKVFGEDNASTSADIVVPLNQQKLPSVSADFVTAAHNYYMGYRNPNNIFDALDITGSAYENYLKLAAYELIYQRHYRNENLESSTDSDLYKMLFGAYQTQLSRHALPDDFAYHIAPREKDYFTGAKPFTQKGDSIHVGLGDEAKLKFSNPYSPSNNVASDTQDLISGISIYDSAEDTNLTMDGNIYKSSDQSGDFKFGIVADLKSATGISIEELRLLIKTQELLEKDAIWGSKYAESLNAHFGCCPLDLTLQDPQELYRTTITSQMQPIFQTSSTSGEASILGTIGANSTTQANFKILPKTKFMEHGILMICAVHKMQNVYASCGNIPKLNFKQSRFDFYTPELNDLGYQPITREVGGTTDIFGYNEAFAEYRYKFNKVFGSLKNTFKYWAPPIEMLSDDTIASAYLEDAGRLDDSLSVKSTTAPQFYDAWGFEETNTKPMSLHSIPGMDGVI